MNGEPIGETPYDPKISTRLILWLAVYLVPQFGLTALLMAKQPPQTFAEGAAEPFFVFLFYPVGLFPFLPVIGYLLYLVHLSFSLCFGRKQYFRIAMIILVMFAVMNLGGWFYAALTHS